MAAAGAPAPAPRYEGDGPASTRFSPVPLKGNASFESLSRADLPQTMKGALAQAPRAPHTAWGIPFRIERPILLQNQTVTETIPELSAGWLVFLHTADIPPLEGDQHGLIRPMRGEGRLGELVAKYTVVYSDGTEDGNEVRRRHHVGTFSRRWGENCFQAVAHRKPRAVAPLRDGSTDGGPGRGRWGNRETMATASDSGLWVNWLWAWQNPHPGKRIAAIRFEPKAGIVIVSAVSGGDATAHPLRWETRRKAILQLPAGRDPQGLMADIQLDMGQVISAEPRTIYPNDAWAASYNNQVPAISRAEVVIEYTAHPDARFHLPGGMAIPVSDVAAGSVRGRLTPVAPATRRVRIRVTEKASGKLTPVKLHLHGESGEYLAPVDRHRYPNSGWFEDYAPEYQNQGRHRTVYIPGEAPVHAANR